MIIGIGNDCVNICRIEKIAQRYKERFLARVFCPAECAYAQAKKNSAASYAKFYAAKEAFLKALGTGLAQGICWHDIEIAHHKTGQPYFIIRNKAEQILKAQLRENHIANYHLSLTDDYPWAQAFVIIEALAI